jgi:hypothetical protein
MKRNPSLRRPYGALTFATVMSAALVTACSSKPPGCADEMTIDAVKTTLLDRWRVVFKDRGFASMFDLTAEQVASFNNALKLEIRSIVSDGYNADAKKYACTGEFVFQTVTGATYTASRRYTSQATAEGGGKFVVQIENGESLVNDLSDGVNSYKAMLMRQEQSVAAKNSDKLSSPPPVDQPLSIAPITQTIEASSPPASPQSQSSQETPRGESQAEGPSFDCAKAGTTVERTICGDPKLAELDVAMVSAYKVVLGKAVDKPGVRTAQATWRDMVRNDCNSVQCLTEAYQKRIDKLNRGDWAWR